MKRALFLLGLLASVAFAADFNGRWAGSFSVTNPEKMTGHMVVNLTQNGNDVTGTAGSEGDQQYPITEGHVDGAKVSFAVQPAQGPLMHFTLTLDGDHLKGEGHGGAGDNDVSLTIDLQKSQQ